MPTDSPPGAPAPASTPNVDAGSSSRPQRVRIATFNVHHCRGSDGKVDIERVASAIRETGASFVGLQELDRNVARSGRTDQPARLSELIGMPVHFFPTLEYQGGLFGLGIAAAGDVETSFERLPRVRATRPHGIVRGRWDGLTIFNTHLSRDKPTNALEVRRLLARAKAVAGPCLIVGDFNLAPRRMRAFGRADFRGGSAFTPTLNSPVRKWLQIDHILGGPGVRVVSTATISTEASDHFPLVADVEIGSGDPVE